MNVEIRRYKEDDLEAINDILATTFPWTRYNITYQVHAESVEDSDLFIVAILEESVVGFGWVVPDGAFARSGYLKLIGVAESSQGQGVGTALLNHAETYVDTATDSTDLFLLVSDFNDTAQAFYRQHGYERIGRLDNYVQEGIDEYVFRKTLHEQ